MRRAVAATLTSVLVFSSILAVNQIAYTADNHWLQAVSVSEMEHAEALNSRILGATAVLNLLLNERTGLSQIGSPSCDGNKTTMTDSAENLAVGEGGVSLTKSIRGVSYSVNVSLRPVKADQAVADNLTLLGTYDGLERGSLNFIAHVSMRATAGRGDPFYSKNETHFVHLPCPVDSSQPCCRSGRVDLPGPVAASNGRRSEVVLGILRSPRLVAHEDNSFTPRCAVPGSSEVRLSPW
jgi:hypothetical protein